LSGVGRIAARVIEQLVEREPLTMRELIDDSGLGAVNSSRYACGYFSRTALACVPSSQRFSSVIVQWQACRASLSYRSALATN
jgi:hypothetical protein